MKLEQIGLVVLIAAIIYGAVATVAISSASLLKPVDVNAQFEATYK